MIQLKKTLAENLKCILNKDGAGGYVVLNYMEQNTTCLCRDYYV